MCVNRCSKCVHEVQTCSKRVQCQQLTRIWCIFPCVTVPLRNFGILINSFQILYLIPVFAHKMCVYAHFYCHMLLLQVAVIEVHRLPEMVRTAITTRATRFHTAPDLALVPGPAYRLLSVI